MTHDHHHKTRVPAVTIREPLKKKEAFNGSDIMVFLYHFLFILEFKIIVNSDIIMIKSKSVV